MLADIIKLTLTSTIYLENNALEGRIKYKFRPLTLERKV